MIEGSCYCGAVKFALKAEPSMMGTCHCSRCRKAGASTIIFVKRDDLFWHQGRDNVALYHPEPPHKYGRCFCKSCGTSLGEILSDEETFPIAAHAIDTPMVIRNQFHEHVADKPDWYEIADQAGQSEGDPA
ncbi:GFA family protein [Aestuariispira insulae]|uniref:CENP-V/GFA domain-containing protein n=1 Tax=Aestuariispira insulae TaxID=1461337 RepID=A0A3D9HRV1_9PROT|nr:GFA family protein [Aestuariispira insulae]RED52244.1 hypothetical protein DFP90_102262 [Aestuariispira insulae]